METNKDITDNSGIIIRFTKHFLWCFDPDTGEYYTLTDGKEREYSRYADMLAGWVSFWEGVDCFVRRRISQAQKMNRENRHAGGVIVKVTKLHQWCYDHKTGEFYTLIDGKEPEMGRSSDRLTSWVYFHARVDTYVRRIIERERKVKIYA